MWPWCLGPQKWVLPARGMWEHADGDGYTWGQCRAWAQCVQGMMGVGVHGDSSGHMSGAWGHVDEAKDMWAGRGGSWGAAQHGEWAERVQGNGTACLDEGCSRITCG